MVLSGKFPGLLKSVTVYISVNQNQAILNMLAGLLGCAKARALSLEGVTTPTTSISFRSILSLALYFKSSSVACLLWLCQVETCLVEKVSQIKSCHMVLAQATVRNSTPNFPTLP